MKTLNQKSGKNTFSKFYLLAVLATTIGFAQTEKQTQETDSKAKSDLSSASLHNNPAFQENKMQGQMLSVSSDGKVESIDDWQTQTSIAPKNVDNEPVLITKQRTKSNNTNERTTKPNGQDDGNPFPPKNLLKKGSTQIATYDVKANKKV